MSKRIPQIIYWTLAFAIFYKGLQMSTDLVDPRKVLRAIEIKIIVFSYSGVLIWAAINFQKIGKLNYVFLLFAFFFASIHWMEYWDCAKHPSHCPDIFGGKISVVKPLLNTLPFVLLYIVSLIQEKKKFEGNLF